MLIFGHARSALKFGLEQMKFDVNSSVLVPNYVCEALVQPFRSLGIKVIFYKIDESFSPIWNDLELLVRQVNPKAIVMVHFFGQPQNIRRFKKLCETHDLILIEDNAHGYGGVYNGLQLGRFGDIGVSSPRKIFSTSTGALLYIKGSLVSSPYVVRDRKDLTKWFVKLLLNFFPKIRYWLLKLLGLIPDDIKDWNFVEAEVRDISADSFSTWQLSKIFNDQELIEKAACRRRHRWKLCQSYIEKNGLSPVLKTVHKHSSPWVFPALCKNNYEKKQFIHKALRKGLTVFSWPSLPLSVKASDKEAKKYWQNFICIELNVGVDRVLKND